MSEAKQSQRRVSPCIGCTQSWSASMKTSCHDVCEKSRRWLLLPTALLLLGCTAPTPAEQAEFRAYIEQELRLESLTPDGSGTGEIEEWLVGNNKLKECIREHRQGGWLMVRIDKRPAHFPFESASVVTFQRP